MDERLALTLSRQRVCVASAAFLGALALVLALVGVYAAVSYGLFQRTREMGIRLALGTTPGRLRTMLLRQTLIVVGAGATAGVLLTVTVGTYTASLVKDAAPAPALIALAFVSIGILTATAIWSASRHIGRWISPTCCASKAQTEASPSVAGAMVTIISSRLAARYSCITSSDR